MPTVDEALQQELLQRAMSADEQTLPTIPSTEFGSRVPDNYGIRRAIDLLHQKGLSAGMPRITTRSTNVPESFLRSIQTNAFVQRGQPGGPFITFNDYTDMYRKASKGNKEAIRQLAAAMAHEKYHVDFGKDELPAYDKQIEVLKLLGGNTKDAEQSKQYIEELLRKYGVDR